VIVFVWVYYSVQIFLLGAESTRVYAKSVGSMKNLPKASRPEMKRRLQSFVIDPRSADAAVGDPVSPCVCKSYPS
jgi:hypothetical protein